MLNILKKLASCPNMGTDISGNDLKLHVYFHTSYFLIKFPCHFPVDCEKLNIKVSYPKC